MFEAIRQFTFNKRKELIQPTIWLCIQIIVTMIPAVLIFLAIYVLGSAFFPPYILDYGALIWLAVGLMACFLLQFAVEIIMYFNTYYPAFKKGSTKRIEYVQKIRKMNLGFFSNKESGELLSSFSNDFSALEQAMCLYLPQPIALIIILLLGLVSLGFYNLPMTIAILAATPVSALIMVFAFRLYAIHSTRILEAKVQAATQLSEYTQGIRVLKNYNQAGAGFERLRASYQDLMEKSLGFETTAGSLTTFCSYLIKFGVPVAAITGMYLVVNGSLEILDFLGFMVIATKLITPLIMGITSLLMLRRYLTSAKRLDGVMTAPVQTGSKHLEGSSSFSMEEVGFSYDGTDEVLNEVNLEIPSNRLTALVGPSGSGKSTIIRLLARFWDPQRGRILADGQDIGKATPQSLHASLSMVMQRTYLFKDTIRNNVLFGRADATEEQLFDACRRAQCHDFIMALPNGYDTMIGEGGATLSGGERQRISVARALLKNAPVLLLDEPTASLDADNEALVQQALDEVACDTTIVMIAHRLQTVAGADQIAVLKEGQIVEKGTHEELMECKDLYRRLWDLQNAAQEMQF